MAAERAEAEIEPTTPERSEVAPTEATSTESDSVKSIHEDETPVEPTSGSALAQVELLQEALSQINLDDQAYREWEESLLALSPQSVPAPAVPTAEEGAVENASPASGSADETPPAVTAFTASAPGGSTEDDSSAFANVTGDSRVDDGDDPEAEHPHRQTFRPTPDGSSTYPPLERPVAAPAPEGSVQPVEAAVESSPRPGSDDGLSSPIEPDPEPSAADDGDAADHGDAADDSDAVDESDGVDDSAYSANPAYAAPLGTSSAMVRPSFPPAAEPHADEATPDDSEAAGVDDLPMSERAAALRSQFDSRRQALSAPAMNIDGDEEESGELDRSDDAPSESPSADFDGLASEQPDAPVRSEAPGVGFPFTASMATNEPALTTGSIPLDPISVSPIESTDTGSIPVFGTSMKLDVDLHDDIDDVTAPEEVLPSGISPTLPVAPAEPGLHTGPITPISTASLIGMLPVVPQVDPEAGDETEADLSDESSPEQAGPPPRVERVGLEPTPTDLRIGRVARMFWLWVAPNSSVLTFGLGAVLIGSGMSARQAIIAALVGLLLACIPLGLSTLASKRSGQPTAVVSRASFGVVGNVVPALLLLGVRLFWISVLLWLLATTFGALVFVSGYDLFVDPDIAGTVALALFGVGAAVLAVLGFRVLARAQAVLAFVGALVAALVIGLTAPQVDFATIAEGADGDWLLVLGGAITVFSLLGTAWAAAGGDLARYQRPDSSGAATVAATGLGAALPAGLLIGWGILLASSNEATSVGLQTDPISTIAGALPGWYPLPLFFAITVSIISGVATVAYSGGLTLIAVGLPMSRITATIVTSVIGIAGGLGILFLLPSLTPVLLDLAPTIAVPVAAWAGIISAEMLIRRRGFDSESLLRRGGVYADVRWVNLVALIVITVLGLGFISGTQGWFVFEGYLWKLLGVDTETGIGGIDLGVLVALLLGLLTPLAFGIRAIRRQEAAGEDAVPVEWTTGGDLALEEEFVDLETVPVERQVDAESDESTAR